jgi:hypothetical protein
MEFDKIVRAPFISPAAPIPATARPTINIFELTETPQRSDPTSKMPTKVRNVHCGMLEDILFREDLRTFELHSEYILPAKGCRAELDSK